MGSVIRLTEAEATRILGEDTAGIRARKPSDPAHATGPMRCNDAVMVRLGCMSVNEWRTGVGLRPIPEPWAEKVTPCDKDQCPLNLTPHRIEPTVVILAILFVSWLLFGYTWILVGAFAITAITVLDALFRIRRVSEYVAQLGIPERTDDAG